MYSTLDVDIRPGTGLGLFELGGTTSYHVSKPELRTEFDHVRFQELHCDVKYDADSPITPIVLHIRPHLDLLFSGYHQRLHTISLRRLRDPHPPVTLRYKNTTLSSTEEVLRRVGVKRAFGPTYPGDDLRYPGVWFSFDEDGRNEGLRPSSPPPDDRMQEVKRVMISQKSENDEPTDALSEVKDGVVLHFYPTSSEPLHIRIGVTTAQDLTCDLGPPPRINYREDDRMTIHSRAGKLDDDLGTSYFYNYFQHGIDFLISGSTHVVKKIIIHTNIPGTALFQQYKRCPWAIEGKPEDDEDDSPPQKWFYDRYEDIGHFLSPGDSPPSMMLDRTDDEEQLTLPSAPTRLLGYNGIILEVTDSAQVATVMLF
ncbi:hypothetical protein NLI96_g2887 [Meripilus lineatus]|uniref:Uncharacterized protein n=1 Tax=Meripilus lineatus TaxID=2056292 RepID=A0AAD5V807_9APHY|nr:hypothetical protein NLI96_g2887 [Physisporinus lineatus]